MMITKKIFALAACFAIFNLDAQDNEMNEIMKKPTVIVNISAQPVTPEVAMIIFTEHAIKNPLQLVHHLIANKMDDFIFTVNNITYIVESNNIIPVAQTTNCNTITINIPAQVISAEEAAVIFVKAAASFFTTNLTDNPTQFINALFMNSHNGFIFTIDGTTYIIQS